jgi:putative nucleotidyltransferase with HDIG domain
MTSATPDPVVAVLEEAERLERAGAVDQAALKYLEVTELARQGKHHRALGRSLLRLAQLRYLQGEPGAARDLCDRSLKTAFAAGEDGVAAEALNALATMELEEGKLELARETCGRALTFGGSDHMLRARIEQTLGILSNIQGDLDGARAHYERSLESYQSISNSRGCGLVYHNLGMMYADREGWDEAERFFDLSRQIAQSTGDAHLEALCSLNQAEVRHAVGSYDDAMSRAQSALSLFEKMGAITDKADSYRVIGMVYRDTDRHVLAEARLTTARELAAQSGSSLSEAEACRELAILSQVMGRNQQALQLLNNSYKLFSSVDARLDLLEVGRKREKLEGTYLVVVKEWGESIESKDSYTFGHCNRVAEYSVAVAQQMELDEGTVTTIRLGAYLHDLGKIKVPHEILNKPGRLTNEEFDVIKKHPEWGVELLDGIEFPWDLKPIILYHHEKYDGTGYPHRLKGDEIPLSAQILCIADVYDALTTTRSYRGAMPLDEALARMAESKHHWRDDVYSAFLEVMEKEKARQSQRGLASAA